ncbi:hypothetical protein [Senegalia massiliensis]|uniref:Uncharacterized protein n=1 Tax=Senegalia massiliensis TaxID=1720316 RepID=A0A845R499_9CLOT|nr:hypothetical protein [Senegalia massiliensis]NBI08242.1 hypothetical protein [Senegalia massiliensis]
MKYFRANLIKKIDTGLKDELGNPTFEETLIPITDCRATEWTTDDVNIYGRDITSSNRKIFIKPNVSLENVYKIKIDNETYNITSIKKLGRWILLIVKGFRI